MVGLGPKPPPSRKGTGMCNLNYSSFAYCGLTPPSVSPVHKTHVHFACRLESWV
jgi:hypothetical protein